jgi:stringent starvation protein B
MKPPGKPETLRAYLERGIAMIHLDARRPGVAVPPQHEGDPHLRINLSYRYGVPDLVIDDTHVQATLSFGGRPFQCHLPWSAVFGITSQTTGDGQVWPEDLPTEVMSTLATTEQRPGDGKGAPKPKPGTPRSKPTLVAVERDPEEKAPVKLQAAPALAKAPETSAPKDPEPPSEPPKKGHLRLIR